MSLEEMVKTAIWCDLGSTNYQETFALQERIAKLRKAGKIKDIILTSEHNPEINFGNSLQHNVFSQEFIRKMQEAGLNPNDESSQIEFLSKRYNLNFSRSSRGGGATTLAPGQIVFYPIVNAKEIVGNSPLVETYKRKLDEIMLEIITELGVEKAYIAQGVNESGRERRDVWVDDKNNERKSYKIGSKGIHFIGLEIAYHGFVIYSEKRGLDYFWMVNPCGYNHEEVSTISVEEITGIKPNKDQIKESARIKLKNKFGYREIEVITPDELNRYLGEKHE